MVDVVVSVVPVLVVVEEAGFDVEDVLLTEVAVELLDVEVDIVKEVVLVAVDVVEDVICFVVTVNVVEKLVVAGGIRVVVFVDEVVVVVSLVVVVVSDITVILNGFSTLPKYAVLLLPEAST